MKNDVDLLVFDAKYFKRKVACKRVEKQILRTKIITVETKLRQKETYKNTFEQKNNFRLPKANFVFDLRKLSTVGVKLVPNDKPV